MKLTTTTKVGAAVLPTPLPVALLSSKRWAISVAGNLPRRANSYEACTTKPISCSQRSCAAVPSKILMGRSWLVFFQHLFSNRDALGEYLDHHQSDVLKRRGLFPIVSAKAAARACPRVLRSSWGSQKPFMESKRYTWFHGVDGLSLGSPQRWPRGLVAPLSRRSWTWPPRTWGRSPQGTSSGSSARWPTWPNRSPIPPRMKIWPRVLAM